MQHWDLIARFGELQALLPAALLVALALLRRPETRALALLWMASLSAALVLTTASKVAFIGWGIGSPELNFTGISGHAMVAAAVYPLLLGSLASRATARGRVAAIGFGCAMALLVGLSRVVLGAHSASEVLAGLCVGGVASAIALDGRRVVRAVVHPVVPATVALWLALTPSLAPASQAHSAVTRLSLMLSGREIPYTRSEMIEELRSREKEQGEGTTVRLFIFRFPGSPSIPGGSSTTRPGVLRDVVSSSRPLIALCVRQQTDVTSIGAQKCSP